MPRGSYLSYSQWKGLWDRGDDTQIPSGYMRIADNLQFDVNRCYSRAGVEALDLTLGKVCRIYQYRNSGQADRNLVLDGAGQIRDAGRAGDPVILTVSGMTDFSAVTIYNRVYITPHDGTKGLAGEFVYVYNGVGSARKAAGFAPDGTLSAALTPSNASPAPEHHRVEPGTRYFAIAYRTDSGHITVPGPKTGNIAERENVGWGMVRYVNSTSSGQSVRVTWTATPPPGASVLLLATKRLVGDFDNFTPDLYAYYAVPGAIVEPDSRGNMADFVDVSFYDSELLARQNDLFQQLEEIPAGLCIGSYQNRLVLGGENALPSRVRLSKAAFPEQVDQVDGFVEIDPAEGSYVQSFVEFRNRLHVHKIQRSYIQGSIAGAEPGLWPDAESIDMGAGTTPHGVAAILDRNGTTVDRYIIADERGLLLYNGTYDTNLTYAINALWKSLDHTNGFTQAFIDPKRESVYVLAERGDEKLILYGDYQDGWEMIKWSVWTLPNDPLSLSSHADAQGKTWLLIGSTNGLYRTGTGVTDYTNRINAVAGTRWEWKNGLMILHSEDLKVRATGEGRIKVVSRSNTESLERLSDLAPGLMRSFRYPDGIRGEQLSWEVRSEEATAQWSLNYIAAMARIVIEREP